MSKKYPNNNKSPMIEDFELVQSGRDDQMKDAVVVGFTFYSEFFPNVKTTKFWMINSPTPNLKEMRIDLLESLIDEFKELLKDAKE